MTIANLEEVLMPAMEEHRAVAGLVVLGWEDANAYVKAADETGIPIILQAGPGCRAHTPIPILGKMFRYLADQTEVPIVCHIDHGSSAEECLEGIYRYQKILKPPSILLRRPMLQEFLSRERSVLLVTRKDLLQNLHYQRKLPDLIMRLVQQL